MPGSLLATLRARHGRPDGPRPTRREMLRLALAGAAGLLLSERASAFHTRPAGGRTLIVGAGFAGLTAAHELAAAGYDVRVFEARNRVGGRVLSFHDMAGGRTVEGGAELIGSNHPMWVALAERFRLAFLDVTGDAGDWPVVIGGRRLRPHETAALFEEMERAYARLNETAAPVDADRPWRSPGAPDLDRTSVGGWIDGLALSPVARAALHAEFSADNGVATHWQSSLANLAQIKGGGLERYWTDSEVFRCRGGNDRLAQALVRALPAGAVTLRAAVRRVVARDTRVEVTLADGRVVEGDDVVVAVPPSVWHRIAFVPGLPVELRPQMGSNVKYLAEVRSRFWQRAGLAPDSLSDGPVQLTWEATDNQPGPGAVLTAFSGGPGADECRSWAPAERANRYLRVLESAHPEVAREFVRGRFMDWPGDVWSLGSYAFPAPGQVTTLGPILDAGLGRLHFAGEHTRYAFIGYMEGALQSGVAVARRLAARDGVVPAPAA